MFLSSCLFIHFLERSDVWDYSEAFTKRYILLIFFGLTLLIVFAVFILLFFPSFS